jgi:preprotein translocase subunit SecE
VARKVIDEPSEDVVATAKRERAERKNPFARIALFLRQVIAELKKVVTPTRRELLNFTAVVLVFVLIMMGLVWGLDQIFSWLVNWAFGNPDLA